MIPDNIILLFQPPDCPELNLIKRLWQLLEKGFALGTVQEPDSTANESEQTDC